MFGPDGGFTYTPYAGFRGVDMFTYRITDSSGSSNEALVTIVVEFGGNAPLDLFVSEIRGNRVTFRWTPAPNSFVHFYEIQGGSLS